MLARNICKRYMDVLGVLVAFYFRCSDNTDSGTLQTTNFAILSDLPLKSNEVPDTLMR